MKIKYDEIIVDGELCCKINPESKKQLLEERYKVYLELSNIPSFYRDVSFSDYQGNKSATEVTYLKKYSKNITTEQYKDTNLYLWGENSTQKTALACNVGKEAIRQGYFVQFVHANILIDYLLKSQGYSIAQDKVIQKLNQLNKADIVIIDDAFDKSKTIMWKSDSKNLIIAEWDTFLRGIIYEKKRLIITSNVTPTVIEKDFNYSLYEVINRNFKIIQCLDNITEFRKERLQR